MKTPKYARDQWTILRNRIVFGGKTGGGGDDADADVADGKSKKTSAKKRGKSSKSEDGCSMLCTLLIGGSQQR